MATLPLSHAPQLLSRASIPPNGDGWIHEIKYDGFRLLAGCKQGRVRIRSRPGSDWTGRLPWIANAVASLRVDGISLDGELVYLADDGFPDFERLRGATQAGKQERLYYQVFDLLSLNGIDLTSRPLIERKERLVEVLARADQPRLRYVAHARGDAAGFFTAVDELGLEGIVCKKTRSLYRPGIRSSDWVKVKCFHSQRFAVVGYTMEDGLLSSLCVAGHTNDGQLHYAGRVEFGVPRRDTSLLNVLRTIREPMVTVAGASAGTSIIWIEPVIAANVRALRWGPGRPLRHAVLQTIV